MFEVDPKLEYNLRTLKEAITPSDNLVRRVQAVTQCAPVRYPWYHMLYKKLFVVVPAVAVALLVVVLNGDRGQRTIPSIISSDDIIASVVNDAHAEQSIIEEADADVELVDGDRAAFDSFAATYNAHEY